MKYGLQEHYIDEMVLDSTTEMRDGFNGFCDLLRKESIPLTIISAGVTNVIESVLKKHSHEVRLPKGTAILANEMRFADGNLVGWSEPLLTSQSKRQCAETYPDVYKERVEGKGVLLFGDSLGDVTMAEGGGH